MTDFQLTELMQLLSYIFVDHSLLVEALSHPSLNHKIKPNEKKVDYERMEFLGDAVINLIVTAQIFKLQPNMVEGEMAKLRSSLVCKENLYQIALSLDLPKFILMTEGEAKGGGRNNKNNLENVLEAIIGAIFLDSGYDDTSKIVKKLWNITSSLPILDFTDSKSSLQEFLQARNLPIPTYKQLTKSGLDHNPLFTIKITVLDISFTAQASTRKAAEKLAAAELLNYLKKTN